MIVPLIENDAFLNFSEDSASSTFNISFRVLRRHCLPCLPCLLRDCICIYTAYQCCYMSSIWYGSLLQLNEFTKYVISELHTLQLAIWMMLLHGVIYSIYAVTLLVEPEVDILGRSIRGIFIALERPSVYTLVGNQPKKWLLEVVSAH